MHPKRSKVYLVGAGPGDPGLLTLKAKAILQKADVVIHDYLANPSLLHYAPQAEWIDAGKRQGQQTITQAEINALLVQKALDNQTVVRLKGGDPFIFGRGGEELSHVLRAQIPFEVIPGVSSAIGVPAYAGIPLTHRDHSSSVVFLTGTENPEKPHTMIPWEAISQMGTIVVMMGLTVLQNVTQRLMEAGRSPNTPVVLVQWGTWPEQRSLQGTLATIFDTASKGQFKAPVLTIIGEVARFYEQFNWFEQQPLFGQHILVTRTETGVSSLTEQLLAQGAQITACPTLALEAPQSWQAFDDMAQKTAELDWVIFTSANGIERCMARLQVLGKDARIFAACKIACVGASSAQCLEQFFLKPDVVPSHFQSEGLVHLLKSHSWKNKQVWLPQAESSRPLLQDSLTQWGAKVHATPVYRTTLPKADLHSLVLLLQEQALHWITFTSSSTVKNFFELLPQPGHVALRHHAPKIACIGEITAQTAQAHGLQVDLIPEQQNIEGLVAGLCAFQKC